MRYLATAFYMILSILGLSVISLGGLIGIQLARGKISGSDLHSVLRVIGGTHRIVVPNPVFDRYMAFAKDEEQARAELAQVRSVPVSREPPALRAKEAQEEQQTNLQVQNRLLDEQKRIIADLRGQVEAQKTQVENLLRMLDEERKKDAIVEKDANTAKLRKTLAEMDAGDIALFLSQIVRDHSQGGPTEAARIIRDHLRPDFSAEVLGEMPAPDRQQVIPLLENRFAGVPPDAVVKIFVDNKLSPGEIMVYMMQMTPAQALGVYLRLPTVLQDQISPQVLRTT